MPTHQARQVTPTASAEQPTGQLLQQELLLVVLQQRLLL